MRVEFLMDVSDERGPHWIGEAGEIPDDRVASWVAAGYVRVLVVPTDPEAATLESEENAALPRARKRG
jgi:hypothetical protein